MKQWVFKVGHQAMKDSDPEEWKPNPRRVRGSLTYCPRWLSRLHREGQPRENPIDSGVQETELGTWGARVYKAEYGKRWELWRTPDTRRGSTTHWERSLSGRLGKSHVKKELEGPVFTGVYFHQPDWKTHNPWGMGKSFLRTGKLS